MRRQGTRAGAWTGFLVLLAVWAILAVVSGLFVRGRVDLTRDRAFTLSPASQKTLDHLHDLVTIKVFFSRDLPSEFRERRTDVKDWLDEFQAHSGGKVKVLYLDPGESEARRKEAEALGVREVSLRSENRESMEVKKGFFGLAILYGDKKETFPVITSLSTFEYDLAVALKRVTGAVKTVGIVQGLDGVRYSVTLPGANSQPRVGFEANFPTLEGEMDRLFHVVDVEPAYGPIDTTIDLLLVAAPFRLAESEKFRIDQFLMHGKAVIFLTPGNDVSMVDGFSSGPTNNDYESLLEFYGLGVSKNVLAESQNWEQLRFGDANVQRPYPYWMVETYGALNPDNPITSHLQSVSFPWASSVEWGPGGQGPLHTEVLVRTSPNAWEETGMRSLLPRDFADYQPQPPRSFPLAVLRTGIFTSFYAQALPPGVPAEDSARALRVSRGPASVLVVGNALFATDFYVSYTGATGNLLLLLNAMSQLTLDPDLITIRSRQITEAVLDPGLSSRLKTPLILINLLLAPVLITLVGLLAASRRRKRAREAGLPATRTSETTP